MGTLRSTCVCCAPFVYWVGRPLTCAPAPPAHSTWLLWEPKLIPSSLASAGYFYWAGLGRYPQIRRLWVVPLAMYCSGGCGLYR